jgi:hypothetical protein
MCAERSPMLSPTWVSGSIAAIPAMAPEIPSSLQSCAGSGATVACERRPREDVSKGL